MLCSVFCCSHVLGLPILKQLSYIVSISLGLLREKVNTFIKWTKLCTHMHIKASSRLKYECLEAELVQI